ncbi:MAG: GFA family protein [Proteobacteria bacterium]|nr:GFA family protein [Pseudomonadota bacterium]
MKKEKLEQTVSGGCYCGAIRFRSAKAPFTVSYCHCVDCRRATGAPVAVFAAFKDEDLTFSPNEGKQVTVNTGASRSFCPDCGSPLASRFDYLPGQTYVAIGIFDHPEAFAPKLHSYDSQRIDWLHIDDDLERLATTSRDKLNESSE